MLNLDTYSLPPKAETGQELGEVEVFIYGQSVGRSALVARREQAGLQWTEPGSVPEVRL